MIRILFIFSLLSASLFARLNPFEPVDGQSVESSSTPRTVTNLNSKDDGNRTVKIVSEKKDEVKKEPKKIVTKEIKSEPIKEVKNESKVIVKEKTIDTAIAAETSKNIDNLTQAKELTDNSKINKTPSVKNKKIKNKKVHKKVVKIKKPVTKKVTKSKNLSKKIAQKNMKKSIRYNVLPLLTIDILDKNLTIKTTNNYKLIRYYEEKTENKFVFDFQANLSVPTANEKLSSQYYKSYIVGNHPEDGYFRVVVPVNDSVSNYKVMIKNNIGTIIRK